MEYATDVVLADDHTSVCVAAGGGCLDETGTPDLRWPGYLGKSYEAGGVLFVGNVHRNFDSNGVTVSLSRDLVAATLALRTDPTAQQAYLTATRASYLSGLAGNPRWKVSSTFDRTRTALGLDWKQLAYTNAGKTQMVNGSKHTKVIKGCLERFPLPDLVKRLDASLVVTCSAEARKQLEAAGLEPVYFPQLWCSAEQAEVAVARCAAWAKQR